MLRRAAARGFKSYVPGPSSSRGQQRGRSLKNPTPTPVIIPSEEVVLAAVDDLHESLVRGLRDMTCNVNMTKDEHGKPSIEVIPDIDAASGATEQLEGAMVVVGIAQDDPKIVTMQSPASNGYYRYQYDQDRKEFIAEDNHELVGMLCRDLLWNCRGMPRF